MSGAATPMPARGRDTRSVDLGAVIVLLIAAVALGWWLTRENEIPLERSAMGHQGLVTWLRAEGVEARYATAVPVAAADVGLRILPIQDTDLETEFVPPAEPEAYMMTGTERDIELGIVIAKTRLLPTLLVAPKWTRAVRHTGFMHDSLLLPAAEVEGALDPLPGLDGIRIERGSALTDIRLWGDAAGSAVLYAPQIFRDLPSGECAAELETSDGIVLMRCPGEGDDFWILSDPDLLNNHGLALGGNADIARDWIAAAAAGEPVLIDTTTRVFVRPDQPPPPRRSWSDLLRFFAWPMSVVWAGLAVVTVLAFWRAWTRFGPPRLAFRDDIGASSAISLAAKARILRMAGNDQRLFELHIRERLKMIEARILGPHRAAGDPLKQVIDVVSRRDPALARGFAEAVSAASTPGPDTSPQRLMALLDDFERQAERVLNAFGRV